MQKEEYDRKHSKLEVFMIRGLDVLETKKKHAGGKIDSKWLGPYTYG